MSFLLAPSYLDGRTGSCYAPQLNSGSPWTGKQDDADVAEIIGAFAACTSMEHPVLALR